MKRNCDVDKKNIYDINNNKNANTNSDNDNRKLNNDIKNDDLNVKTKMIFVIKM